jgi:hypothetical protein
MASKIEAATSSVRVGAKCRACVVASGADLNSIRAILGPIQKYGTKGTLFVTPSSDLEAQAIQDEKDQEVSRSRRKIKSEKISF